MPNVISSQSFHIAGCSKKLMYMRKGKYLQSMGLCQPEDTRHIALLDLKIVCTSIDVVYVYNIVALYV